jgi:hypothetical protein
MGGSLTCGSGSRQLVSEQPTLVRIIDKGLAYGSEGWPVIADHSHESSFLTDSHLALRPGSAIPRPMQQERLKSVDCSSESRFLTLCGLELVPQL